MSTDHDSSGTRVTCGACGGSNQASARFCRDCGASLAQSSPAEPQSAQGVAAPPPPQSGGPAGQPANAAPSLAPPGPKPADPVRRLLMDGPAMFVAMGVGAVLAAAAIAYVLIADPFNLSLFLPTVKGFANQDLAVVDSWRSPTPKVLGRLRRGDPISGHWMHAPPGQARWLRVDWPGANKAYVWGHAISMKARPELASTTPVSVPASVGGQVLAEPDEASTVIDTIMPGEAANVVGTTADGWAELSLTMGGVGYVKTTLFAGPINAAAGVAGVDHYVCRLSAADSVNVPVNTPNLSFVLDTNRRCVDHRYPYAQDETGALKRLIFDDKNQRLSLLQLTADKQTFQRTDIKLDPKRYAALSKHAVQLDNGECPLPGDLTNAAVTNQSLNKLIPIIAAPDLSQATSRRVWRCTAGQ